MLATFALGLGFGFIGSMPVAGPIAVLVFSRGLQGQMRSGVYIAIGSAFAESLYAFLAYWGFGELLSEYDSLRVASQAAGALILFALGVHFLRLKSHPGASPHVRKTRRGSLLLGFTICALNPTLIATWTAAVTTAFSTGVVSFDEHAAIPFSVGVALGIVGWFSLLLESMRRFKGSFSVAALDRLARVIGVMLLCIAGWFTVRFAVELV